jgi:hypothetical protein
MQRIHKEVDKKGEGLKTYILNAHKIVCDQGSVEKAILLVRLLAGGLRVKLVSL